MESFSPRQSWIRASTRPASPNGSDAHVGDPRQVCALTHDRAELESRG